jgi:two-component sensor histidine kinase
MKFTEALEADDAVLRELHHRLRNNFQTISSLVSLQARALPDDRRGELRFVEEHVQAMAAAYRVVRVSARVMDVVLADLVADVVGSLRQIAEQPRDSVALELATGTCLMRIDQAISMGLYLAAVVPPYLDRAVLGDGTLRIAMTALDAEWMRLAVTQLGPTGQPRPNLLRQRLAKIYLSQLGAEMETAAEPGTIAVRIHVPPRQSAGAS